MNTAFAFSNPSPLSRERMLGFARKYLITALLVVLLAGCAGTPEAPPVVYNSIGERQRVLAALEVWSASGRIALSSPTEGFSASMDWRQIRTDYDVELTALLGQRALRVTQQGAQAMLEARGRKGVMGVNAEKLLLNELGVRVPLSQMAFWIKGLPGTRAKPGYDTAGRLQQLAYVDADGTQWVADFKRYQRVDDLELPALIDIKGQDYSIRLLIKSWKTVPVPPQSPPQQTPGRLQIPTA